MPKLKTCEICGFEWDPHPWTRCPRCAGRSTAYEPTPAEIRAACERIRKRWPKCRLLREERQPEIPTVSWVGDGMVRRDADGRA
jgi:hypothetical protein